jgi:predicted nucleotidyltransferase
MRDTMPSTTDLRDVPEDIRCDVARGVDILKSGGCREVYVFGSVAERRVNPHSDIDFAVRGCPPSRFFKLQGRLLVDLSRSADLVDLDADPDLADFLEREAVLIHVG